MSRHRKAVVSPKGAVAEEGETCGLPSGRADNIRPTAAFVERYVLIVIFPPAPAAREPISVNTQRMPNAFAVFLQWAVQHKRGG